MVDMGRTTEKTMTKRQWFIQLYTTYIHIIHARNTHTHPKSPEARKKAKFTSPEPEGEGYAYYKRQVMYVIELLCTISSTSTYMLLLHKTMFVTALRICYISAHAQTNQPLELADEADDVNWTERLLRLVIMVNQRRQGDKEYVIL